METLEQILNVYGTKLIGDYLNFTKNNLQKTINKSLKKIEKVEMTACTLVTL